MIREYTRELEDLILTVIDDVTPDQLSEFTGMGLTKAVELYKAKDFILSHRNVLEPFSKAEYYDALIGFPACLDDKMRKNICEYLLNNQFKKKDIIIKMVEDRELLVALYVTVPRMAIKDLMSKSEYVHMLYEICCDMGAIVREDIFIYTSRQIKYISTVIEQYTKTDLGCELSYKIMNDIFKERFKVELNEYK